MYLKEFNFKYKPSCGNLITLLGSDGEPSPTLFTALTRN